MCLICIEFAKQRMTAREARRAYGEMLSTLEDDHARKVDAMIEQAERAEAEDERD